MQRRGSCAVSETATCWRPQPGASRPQGPAGNCKAPPPPPACEVMRSTMGCHCPLRSLKPRNCSTGLLGGGAGGGQHHTFLSPRSPFMI